ncbi:hypothetical protein C0992_002530 [Termitomyces sp. T32_za158]|nr:hypothetical protein C0992_002530 [Termitomyces sp. T32_za158]
MKKTTTAFTAQLVTYETTLPFDEVIARLDAQVNKPPAGGIMPAMASARTKQDVIDAVTNATRGNDFAYFFDLSHKWMNVYHETNDTPRAVVYAIGNPLLAETFLRHDIRAGYNVPPRLMVVQGADALTTTVFYHLPSSLVLPDNDEVVKALRVLDDKLEQMITRVTTE